MSESSEVHDRRLIDYIRTHTTPPDALQLDLIEATRQRTDMAGMQIGAEQGAFMTLLTRALAPRLAIEVGTFTGYSALAVARALPPDGRLICCDVSHEWTSIAREFWERAGVAERIELRIGPAIETLRALPPDPVIDLAFIDADKSGYVDYYEELLLRLSPTGLILVDNVLWSGRVLEQGDPGSDTEALRAFNDHVLADSRTDVALMPIGDGLSVIGLNS